MIYIVDEKIFSKKISMRVVSVKTNDLQAIWWSDFTTFIQFSDFSVKVGLFSFSYWGFHEKGINSYLST